MSVVIDKAKLKNFCQFEDFECKFFDGVTWITGMNRSGKTTIGLKGLIACINGISEQKTSGGLFGIRYKFIGSHGVSSDIEYQFRDTVTDATITIKNHITKSGNKITIKCSNDLPLNEQWLKSFFNIALMSTKRFCSLSGQEQAKALGIDTSSFDLELKKYKTEFTDLNSQLKAFGKLDEMEPVEYIDINKIEERRQRLLVELNKIYKENHNENIRRRERREKSLLEGERQLNKWKVEQAEKKEVIEQCIESLNLLKSAGYQGNEVNEFIDSLPQPEKDKPEIKIMETVLIEPEYPESEELKNIEAEKQFAFENNVKFELFKAYLEKRKKITDINNSINRNKKCQEGCITARNNYMSSNNLSFKGLSIDEYGCLQLNDRPIKEEYFSTSELEIIVAKLHASLNPEFKVRFIDDFERLDSDNQVKLIKDLFAMGIEQIIVAEVGIKNDRENAIVLSECKLKEPEDNKEKLI